MDKDAQQALNKKFVDAADNGNASEVLSLLEAGADVNGRHCLDGCNHTALMKAAAKGYTSLVTMLLERGADTQLQGSEKKTAEQMARDANKYEAVERIRAFEEMTEQAKSPDRISLYSPVGGRVREDVYDFSMKERVTLIRKGRFGEVEAMTVTGFSAIEDQSETSMLRKAFNEHVARGGSSDETVVFSGQIRKPKFTPQKGL
jgi:hypothetical protein